jgi:cellulose synthase/poly-beta-1,6-N-acetylglucosamine synthase-like glycosyltransferase
MTVAALAVVTVSSVLLFVYGANLLFVSLRALKLPPLQKGGPRLASAPAAPRVAVQLPVYNERYVAERAIDAACRLDWPRDRLQVQVLDDSDDDTPEIVARASGRWRARGVDVRHLRRGSRAGYKAGALAYGLERTDAELLALFDADFVPSPDFLQRMVPSFRDPRVGFVQARWGHLNEGHSLFTRLQALMVDFHFLVEQAVRPALGCMSNFTGSAGVWRRAAVEDAGGWSAATLTEDLDLSYRAQLRGWRAAYVESVVVPQEVPVSVNGYRSQQARWAAGSFQCAARLLGPVLRSRRPPLVKFEAAVHLLGYSAPVLMLVQVACYPILVVGYASRPPDGLTWPLLVSLLSLSPAVGLTIAQRRRGVSWWRVIPACLAWSVVGAGTSLTVAGSLWRAARGGGEFRRTPKFGVEGHQAGWRSKSYFRPRDVGSQVELGFGVAALALGYAALSAGRWLLAAYSLLFAAGFLAMSLGSFAQASRDPRAFGRGVAAVGAAGILLLVLARWLPDPFEDSYQHWLIAANLASTGRLQDPLFQMQDTWLPAYHLLAAAALRLFGLRELVALKAVNAGLAIGVLALTYRLAPNARQGMVAVALLALNPIFLLTSTTAVAEPLLLLGLMGTVACLAENRPRLAAACACVAVLTGTKAWLWLACLAAALAVDWALRHRRRVAVLRPAWVVPAAGLVVLLQLRFGFASHSLARGMVEVASASSRGSLAASPPARGGSFLGYFALASLPLVALAPLGLARSLRSRAVVLLYAPSAAYLGVVTALVWTGAYSGSHRYYYLALPAAALLAAAGLDRLPRLASVAAVGLGAAVVGLYIPVLVGLAADNRGLVAAGQAAAVVPGELLTDSPAAAYYSGKPPSQIFGSRELPADRSQAVDEVRARGVGPVVLEGISYYRASSLFPDLSTGSVSAPFLRVGRESTYTVPGGKRVFVYGLSRGSADLGDQVSVAVSEGASPARGKTAPLARGAVLQHHGADLAGGGLGFGVPIARFDDGWWFAGAPGASVAESPDGGWTKAFDLTLHEVDDPSGHFLRFESGPSHGTYQVTYRPAMGRGFQVTVRRLGPAALGLRQVVVLNEESAAFDDLATSRLTLRGSGIGSSVPIQGSSWARFRSHAADVEWSLAPPGGGGQWRFSRELLPNRGIDFSGIEYSFGPDFTSADYGVGVKRSPAQRQ